LAVEDAAAWNHGFWEKRNRNFFGERERFVRASIQKARAAPTHSGLEQPRIKTATDNNDHNDDVAKPAPAAGAVSTEEMSDFYREFLSANKSEHLNYMKGWYVRNFRVLKTGLLWFLSEWNVFRHRQR